MLAKQTASVFLLGVLLAGVLGIVDMATALEVGDKAPDFTLRSTTGQDISLSQFQGKKQVLIEFYTGDFDPVWTKNLSTRKVDYNKFQELDVQLLGIGPSLPFSQKMLADSMELPYPLLSDYPELEVIRDYGVLAPDGIQRLFFLVDQDGIIRGLWHGENTGVFSNEPLLKAAQEISGKPE